MQTKITYTLIVAVRLQLYKMASSPNTFPGGMILRNFPSLETSTFPSEKRMKLLFFTNQWNYVVGIFYTMTLCLYIYVFLKWII